VEALDAYLFVNLIYIADFGVSEQLSSAAETSNKMIGDYSCNHSLLTWC